jgi:hypothetical protein
MRYMFLVYNDEHTYPADGTPEQQARYNAYMAFGDQMTKEGDILGADRLQPVATATTVRIRDGRTQVTDGPVAETKEQLGGYYILECKDLDQALARAAQIPGALDGCIEVRPIFDMG